MEFAIPFYISNGGDGSANLRLCTTLAEAKQEDEDQPEGWGESSAEEIIIKVKDGKVYFKDFRDVGGKYQFVWVEIPQGSESRDA